MTTDEGRRPARAAFRNDLSGEVHGPVVQAQSIDRVVFQSDKPPHPVPFQLPPAPRLFTNRTREVAELEQGLAGATNAPLLVVISGAAGVGKTTLALRWLHDHRERFPDGQLYVDLGAFTEGGPVEPADALEWFLRALGVATEQIPPDLAGRQSLYRTLVNDRAVAILLDNALSTAQVRPLFPVSHRSVAVVTSRWRLAGLHLDGARFIHAEPLDVQDSVRLLIDLVGDERMSVQRTEAEELARLCGGLPIALSVIGARLSARPHRSLSSEVGALRGDKLATLSVRDELSVEVVFDKSYEDLPSDQAHLYRVCSLHPGPAFGLDIAAAMADLPVDRAEDTLDTLVQRNLLAEVDDRRFRYHDLLFAYARQRAHREESEAAREAVSRRLVEWYLDAAVSADLFLRPTRRRISDRFRQRSGANRFHDHAETLRWLDRERHNIIQATHIAVDHDWHQLAWEFCEAMWGYYLHARNYGDWLEIHDLGIPAARSSSNPVAEAQLRNQRGTALTNLHRYDDAMDEHLRALRLAEENDDRFITAAALSELAGAAQGRDDLEEALGYLYRAKEIREVIGTERALALCRRRIGEVLCELGRHEEAATELREAADALAPLDQGQHARALTSLGANYVRWGRPGEAEEPLVTALAMSTRLGSPHYRARALTALGDLTRLTGDLDAARRHYGEAHRIYVESGDPRTADLSDRLSDVTPAR